MGREWGGRTRDGFLGDRRGESSSSHMKPSGPKYGRFPPDFFLHFRHATWLLSFSKSNFLRNRFWVSFSPILSNSSSDFHFQNRTFISLVGCAWKVWICAIFWVIDGWVPAVWNTKVMGQLQNIFGYTSPQKQTWLAGKSSFCNRSYILKRLFFHCHISFRGVYRRMGNGEMGH